MGPERRSLLRMPRALWRRQIGIRLVATLVACSLALGSISGYLSYRTEEQAYQTQLERFGRTLAQAAALACPDAILIEPPDYILLQTYVDELTSSDAKVAFAMVERSADGKVLARSPAEGPLQSTSDTLVMPMPIRIDRDGDVLGRFVLGMSLLPMRAALRVRAVGLLLQTTVTCLLVALVLLLVLRSLVIRPLHVLDEHARRIAHGDLGGALPGLGENELGRLGATMEKMRANLRANHESLAAQNRQLRELDQMKSQFLANMSHEIRTPINAMLGSAELLLEPDLAAGERQSYLNALRWNGTHLLELVNTLLDLSKIESGKHIVEPVPCRPADVLQDVVACMKPLAETRKLYLRADLGPPAAATTEKWIMTDPMRLRQILINVIGNALKFTEHGGVELRCQPVRNGSDTLLEFRVTDTGIGMSPEFLRQVFEPFTQADGSITRRFGGSGLGLSIARKLARQLGGDITASSEPGRGTCMVITVAAPDATPPPAPVAAPAAPQQRFSGRVLVVDDSVDNQRLLSAMLRKAGVDVDVAANGKLAIDRVAAERERGESYHLILMDVQMPEMDGLTATRWLREHQVDMPIVALTAHAMAEDRNNCLDAGCDDYETKPISRARLLAVLGRHLPAAPVG